MKITHLWQDYSPNLFDKSHPLCLAHAVGSEVVCQAFIENGAAPLPGTFWHRRRDPAESNSQALTTRLMRRLRRPLDLAGFARLVRARVQAFQPDLLHLHFGTTATMSFESFSEMMFRFRITPALVVKGLIFSVIVGFFGSLLPAIRASRLPVIAALKAV